MCGTIWRYYNDDFISSDQMGQTFLKAWHVGNVNCCAFGSEAVTTCTYDLGLSRLGFENPTFRLRGERSSPLRHRRFVYRTSKVDLHLIIELTSLNFFPNYAAKFSNEKKSSAWSICKKYISYQLIIYNELFSVYKLKNTIHHINISKTSDSIFVSLLCQICPQVFCSIQNEYSKCIINTDF